MSEARELLLRAIAVANKHALEATDRSVAATHSIIAGNLSEALATQPEPAPVPELPEGVQVLSDEFGYRFRVGDALVFAQPDDLDRIAEACRILAARERARRAGS